MACVAALDHPVVDPFVFSCNGIRISAAATPPLPAPYTAPSEPARPIGKDLLAVPTISRKFLTPEELEQRAELVAVEQRRDSAVDRTVARTGYWWPRT